MPNMSCLTCTARPLNVWPDPVIRPWIWLVSVGLWPRACLGPPCCFPHEHGEKARGRSPVQSCIMAPLNPTDAPTFLPCDPYDVAVWKSRMDRGHCRAHATCNGSFNKANSAMFGYKTLSKCKPQQATKPHRQPWRRPDTPPKPQTPRGY